MERILIMAGDAAEDLEVMYCVYRFRDAGYAVDLAAPERRRIQLVVHDFEDGNDAYVEKPGRRIMADLAFAEVDPDRYVGVVIPGGRAPEYMRLLPECRRLVEAFAARDVPIGTICHGPQVLAAYGLLQGKRCSAFPPLGPDVELAGGTFVEGPAVVDGNLVSCAGWGDLAEWGKAFLAVVAARAAVPA